MKKIMWTVLLGAVLVLPAAAKPRTMRGSEQHKTQEVYTVAPFTDLSVSGQLEVEFTQGPQGTYTVQYAGPYNLVQRINVQSQDGVLSVSYTEPLQILGDEHVLVKVAAPDLRRIEIKNLGEVHAHEALSVDSLSVWADGKAEIELDKVSARSVSADLRGDAEVEFLSLTCELLQVKATHTATFDSQRTDCDTVISQGYNRSEIILSGLNSGQVSAENFDSSEMEIKGKTNSVSLAAHGRSQIDAGGLQAEDADVTVEKTGHVNVRASGTLNAQTEGRGTVEYKGWPQQINQTGKGTVKRNK